MYNNFYKGISILTGQHVIVRIVRDWEQMGRHLSPSLAPVFSDYISSVDG